MIDPVQTRTAIEANIALQNRIMHEASSLMRRLEDTLDQFRHYTTINTALAEMLGAGSLKVPTAEEMKGLVSPKPILACTPTPATGGGVAGSGKVMIVDTYKGDEAPADAAPKPPKPPKTPKVKKEKPAPEETEAEVHDTETPTPHIIASADVVRLCMDQSAKFGREKVLAVLNSQGYPRVMDIPMDKLNVVADALKALV